MCGFHLYLVYKQMHENSTHCRQLTITEQRMPIENAYPLVPCDEEFFVTAYICMSKGFEGHRLQAHAQIG